MVTSRPSTPPSASLKPKKVTLLARQRWQPRCLDGLFLVIELHVDCAQKYQPGHHRVLVYTSPTSPSTLFVRIPTKMEVFHVEAEMASSLAEMSDEELHAFAELQEDPVSDAQIELFIYVCFYISKKTDSMEYLQRALQRAEGWVAVTPESHQERARRSQIFDTLWATTCKRDGDIQDLEELDLSRERMVLPRGIGDFSAQSQKAARLAESYLRTGAMEDLEEAIRITEALLRVVPTGHNHKDRILGGLGAMFGLRYEAKGSMDDLNRAVTAADDAVATTPLDNPNRTGHLNNLGMWLGTRHERTGSVDDLNRAITAADDAVATTPTDNPIRAAYLNNLARWLCRRFERTGAMDDLDRAIDVCDSAIAATSPSNTDRAVYLNNLGIWLCTRFERTGNMDDLNRAVLVGDLAVAATSLDHPNRAACLNSLGNRLGTRFERTGAMDDLNRAIDVANTAIDITPPGNSNRSAYLNNLGNRLCRRFERTGAIADLDRGIDVAGSAVAAAPLDHPARSIYTNTLGSLLGRRFERASDIDDLNRAIDAAGMTVAATPLNDPRRSGRLSNLGIWLGARFERTGAVDDLNRAIDAAEKAVEATPPNHPNQATNLNNLGKSLNTRFELKGDMEDLNRSLLSAKAGWNCRNAPPSVRISLARQAARFLAFQSNWKESSQILQSAAELLPTVSPRSLKNADKQEMLGQFAGLASMAAATALNAGKEAYHALKLLELGRGVIAGLLLEMRTDISDIKQQHPELAEEFMSLRDQLDLPTDSTALPTPGDGMPSLAPQGNRRYEVGEKFDMVVTRIRAQPGFQNFLLPPTAEELMAAAESGPIAVVNVDPYRCDAFLIEHHQIRVLELPQLSLEEVKKRAQGVQSACVTLETLEWLWDVAACPILEALGFQQSPVDDSWPHLWWILTGPLCHLPLHAAGYHAQGSSATVLDRVMSSYISSVKALIYGRRHSVPKLIPSTSKDALLVGMRETPGLSRNPVLPFVRDEVEMLEELWLSLQLKLVKPQPLKKDVLSQLRTCQIFHFAGHGYSDPLEPSQSCLLLRDWKTDPLTVADLRDHSFQGNSLFLAYLSACSTGASNVERFTDEAIHLVSACQLAGFRHVVGTLWEVSDSHCVSVARLLYETIRDKGMTDGAICKGLHKAVRALRDSDIGPRQVANRTSAVGTANTNLVLEAAKAGDSVAGIIDDGHARPAEESSAPGTMNINGHVSVTSGQIEIQTASEKGIEGENGRNEDPGAIDRKNTTLEERNVVPLGRKGYKTRQKRTLSWVPYIHFGV